MPCSYSSSATRYRFLLLPALFSCFLLQKGYAGERPPSRDSLTTTLTVDTAAQKVIVQMQGQLFTSYCYERTQEKPVLFPILTHTGRSITRGFPVNPQPGERADHPHHLGLWFNYGDVNGLDFWNNSYAVAPEKKMHYGKIIHQKILKAQSLSPDSALLQVACTWRSETGKTLLEEITTFYFINQGFTRIIIRKTTLTALQEPVLFKDNKEGMLGIRMARALELPDDSPTQLIGADGRPGKEKMVEHKSATGNYLGSTGISGEEVWGTRGRWMCLSGSIQDEKVSVAILDHPHNIGFPTYWHARGYGLFAANPLGQNVFSKGKETLNFKLAPGESTTFMYQIVVQSGQELQSEQVDHLAEKFATFKGL